MDLKVLRKELTPRSTIGELHVDGVFECYTLEDAVRPVKIKGVTAIPAGMYEVIVSFSQRFQKPLPLLLDVPNFDGVRIHAGNTDADTEGCLLVGKTKSPDMIGQSRAAFDAVFSKIQKAAETEKIFIEIVQPGDAAQVPMPASRGARSIRREMTSPADAAEPGPTKKRKASTGDPAKAKKEKGKGRKASA